MRFNFFLLAHGLIRGLMKRSQFFKTVLTVFTN
jgi:hypothetical protein